MEAHTVAIPITVGREAVADWSPLREPTRRSPLDAVAARERLGRRSLAVADVFASLIALVAASVTVGHGVPGAALVVVPMVVFAAKAIGLYDRDESLVHRSTLDELPQLLHLATLFAFIAWLIGGPFGGNDLGRGGSVVLWVTFVAVVAAARLAARYLAATLSSRERCMVVGPVASANELAATLDRDNARTRVAAMADIASLDGCNPDELKALVGDLDIHRIILISDHENRQVMLDLIRSAKAIGLRISVAPRLMEVIGSQVQFDNVGGTVLLGVRGTRLSRSSRFLKRGFDLACASLLLVAAAPLIALIALAVKIGSRGPVLYRQTRVGRGGSHFDILKFRTMEVGAHEKRSELASLNEAVGLFKIQDDPRVTRVGRVLRRLSLDELPQLVNVLLGDMSIVGPRPLVVEEDAKITGLDRQRLNLTPGMTGQWQILGSARVPLAEMVKIDYLYVAGWTLWADIKLLLRTVPYVLSRRGM
ncbi:MAG: hypothetical protein QOC92_1318 [Acidimicrobiaceae bacterium]